MKSEIRLRRIDQLEVSGLRGLQFYTLERERERAPSDNGMEKGTGIQIRWRFFCGM